MFDEFLSFRHKERSFFIRTIQYLNPFGDTEPKLPEEHFTKGAKTHTGYQKYIVFGKSMSKKTVTTEMPQQRVSYKILRM